MAKVIIPTPLRKFTENAGSIQTNGSNVQEAIEQLTEFYPELRKHIFDDGGHIRNFVRIYVGDDDIKSLQNESTPVNKDTVVSIIPAIAGGIGQNN